MTEIASTKDLGRTENRVTQMAEADHTREQANHEIWLIVSLAVEGETLVQQDPLGGLVRILNESTKQNTRDDLYKQH